MKKNKCICIVTVLICLCVVAIVFYNVKHKDDSINDHNDILVDDGTGSNIKEDVVSYRYDGKKIASEYKVVGSDKDFVATENTDGSLSLKWAAAGKYDFNYCYVIPPITEFVDGVESIDSIVFDDKCKEVYFSDGCFPIYDTVGGQNIEKVFISSTVSYIESLGSAKVYYSKRCNMARSPQIIDNNNITEIALPDNMYEIYNISNLKNLTKVTLPKNLRNIMMCFGECNKLEQVDIPYTMIEGIYTSFHDCESLKNVNITFGVKIIYESFFNCPELQTVYIPKYTLISEGSFINCPKLVLKVAHDSPGEKYALEHNINIEYY